VACENCDAADAQQRAYAYTMSRPLHLLGYGVVALAGLALGYLVVAVFLATTLECAARLFAIAGGEGMHGLGGFSIFDLNPRGRHTLALSLGERATLGLVTFWQTLAAALLPAYLLAYLFAAATRVYLLMRLVCDGQAADEIWRAGMIPGTLAAAPETQQD
jgi:hypothetical protein